MTMATASTSSPARTHAPPAAAPPASAAPPAASAAGGFMYALPQFKGIVNASRQQSKSASKIERSVTRSASGDGSPIPNTEQALRLKQTKPNRSTFHVQTVPCSLRLASPCSIPCCQASNHILLATFIKHSGSTSVGC